MSNLTFLQMALLAGLVGMFAWLVWGLICNEMTYHQRRQLIRAVSKSLEQGKLGPFESYMAVSYDQHLKALQFLRNPYGLYSTELLLAVATQPEGQTP